MIAISTPPIITLLYRMKLGACTELYKIEFSGVHELHYVAG